LDAFISVVKEYEIVMPSACKVYELGDVSKLPLIREALEAGAKSERSDSIKLAVLESSRTSLRGVAELAGEGHKVAFEIFGFRGKLFLLVPAGKKVARRVAKAISELTGVEVREAVLPSRKLEVLLAEGVVKLVIFDMVRIPGLRRVMLTGDAVSDTEIFKELFQACVIKYVVFEDREGILLGVSDSFSVVAFSRLAGEDLLELVKEKLLPLAAGEPW